MIDKLYDQKICTWLDEHRDEIVAELMSLVRIPSVRGDAADGAPFGVECRRALEASAQLLADRGFAAKIEAERGYALARSEGEGKTIALLAHVDVVPAEDDWIYTSPFEPIIQNGVLIGRGSGDNKAGVMACICAMRMVRELGLPVRSNLIAVFGANEETGMADIQAFVAHEPMPDISLIPDGYFPCSLGERSKLGLWVECRTPFRAIRDFRGGVSSTVVMGTAEVRLAADKALAQVLQKKIEGDDRFTLREVSDGLLLQAFGRPAHAATNPEEGVNAAVLVAELLIGCDPLPENDRRILRLVASALSDPFGHGQEIAHEDTRFGALTAANGLAEVKEGCLRLNLDVRYGTELESALLLKQLEHFWDSHGWDMEVITCREGCQVDDSYPVPKVICDIYRELTGEDKPAFYMAGATHAHYMKNGISMGFCVEPKEPKLALPQGHGGAHQSDEALDIDGFLLAIRILMHTLLQCDALLHD